MQRAVQRLQATLLERCAQAAVTQRCIDAGAAACSVWRACAPQVPAPTAAPGAPWGAHAPLRSAARSFASSPATEQASSSGRGSEGEGVVRLDPSAVQVCARTRAHAHARMVPSPARRPPARLRCGARWCTLAPAPCGTPRERPLALRPAPPAPYPHPRSACCSCSARRAAARRCCCEWRWRAAAAAASSTNSAWTAPSTQTTGGAEFDCRAAHGAWCVASGTGACGPSASRGPRVALCRRAGAHPASPCTRRPAARVFESGGAKLVTDGVSLEFLKGAVVEFEDSLMRSAFQASAARPCAMRHSPCAMLAPQHAAACGACATLWCHFHHPQPQLPAPDPDQSACHRPNPPALQIQSNPNSESTCGCGSSFVAKS